jgi:transposase
MIYSLVARITERIPTIKDLIRRLKNDYIFRLDCGFLLSDMVPSEASYSRMLTKISEKNVLGQVQETLLLQAISEGFLDDKTIAIDATHIKVRDQAQHIGVVGLSTNAELYSVKVLDNLGNGTYADIAKGLNGDY